MKFLKTKIQGVYIIEIEKIIDKRGFFARSFDRNEFIKFNLNEKTVQCSISFNKKKGTIRGLHYQTKPYEEERIVRCTQGAIFDVIVDLRPKSKTFKQSFTIQLSEQNHTMLYVPKGVAHGFQTLENNSEIFYQMSQYYSLSHSTGVRWNDPAFSIKWPLKVALISEKDRSFPDFTL